MSQATQEEINKFLTEAMGYCSWAHDHTCNSRCTSAGGKIPHYLNLFTWEGFGKLWGWVQKQDWWKTFGQKAYCGYYSKSPAYPYQLAYGVVNPDRLATAVYNFLKDQRR